MNLAQAENDTIQFGRLISFLEAAFAKADEFKTAKTKLLHAVDDLQGFTKSTSSPPPTQYAADLLNANIAWLLEKADEFETAKTKLLHAIRDLQEFAKSTSSPPPTQYPADLLNANIAYLKSVAQCAD